MKRIVTLLLLAALLCCLMSPASAAVIDPIEPYFQKIISTYVGQYRTEKSAKYRRV